MNGYIKLLISVSIIFAAVKYLLPEGTVKKYGVFAISVILSLCIINPILSLSTENFIENFNIEFDSREYISDEQTAIAAENTVRAVKGFEYATVTVSKGVITVNPNNDGVISSTEKNVNAEYAKMLLKELYRAKEVIIKGESD